MSRLLALAAAHNPDAGFDVFTILGIIGIILGIIVLALRVAGHGYVEDIPHIRADNAAEPADAASSLDTECVAGE